MRKTAKRFGQKRKLPSDPVHRLIRAASQSWAAIAADSGDDNVRFERLVDTDWAVVDKIIEHQPQTAAGLAAQLRFVQSRMAVEAMRDEARMTAILANLAAAAEQIGKRSHPRAA